MADNEAGRVVSPAQVGRAAELERLVAAVLAPPAVVVIEGEAGIGKTRLVTELAARPEIRDRRLLVGRCHGIRESFPLGPVIEALRDQGEQLTRVSLSPVAGALRPLLPELADQLPPPPDSLADQGVERHRVFRGLVEVLSALAPAIVVLEDLHWADEQTADFVGYLLSEAPAGLSVVLTFRGEDVDPAVRALTVKRHQSMTRTDLTLAPLDAAQTGVLAAAILGVDRVSDEFAAYLCERASGSPFAIEELLALLRTRGTLVRRGGGWARRALAELDVPTSIRESVAERVSRLSAAARAVVEAAAVLHVAVPLAVLEATSHPISESVLLGLEEALESGLLVEDGDKVGFRHVLAAQAVYEEIPGPRRRTLHAQAAQVLAEAAPTRLGQIAHHLQHAGQTEEWVVAAERAAEQALALGHDAEAVRLLEQVLRHAPLSPDRAGQLAIKLGQAAIEALATRETADLLADILQRELSPAIRGELRFRLALLLHELGDDPARERQVFTDAVAELDERPDLQAWAAMVLGIPTEAGVELAEHRRWLQRALELLPRVPDPTFQAFVRGKAAMVLASIGDPGWRELIEGIERSAGDTPRHRSEVNAYWSVGTEACYAGHYQTAQRLLARALAGSTVGESPRLQLSIRSGMSLLRFCRGEWDGLADEIEALLDELAGHPRASADARVAGGCLALARGELDQAEQQLSELLTQIEALGGFDLLPLPAAARLRLALARDEVPVALATVERLLTIVADKRVWATAVRALPAMVETLLAADQPERARHLVRHATTELAELDVPLGTAALAQASGLLARFDGDEPAAADRFRQAAREYRARECPYEAAQAQEEAARSLFGTADDRAGPTLLVALADYRRLGANWDAARVSRLARKHGLPVPARHRGGRRSYGNQLSPRERQVAELAAIGRSNKEIAAELYLSVHTVARHITSAMRKLDVRSRAAIANRLAEQ
ncbi:MAG TPA: AAA family ATPase [Natronosporangium sp.]|nr:AAA family ATPase [Natronosporangium sp.]